jgi:hypothetical protein
MERRSSQIGMDDYAGRINDPTESRPDLKLYFPLEEGIKMLEGKEGIF